MEDARRWSVTYTKHVKQKRKVYQDGFLEHQHSRHKVLLYDEWDNLLESRFVKKDDVIKSGETLTSDSHLVDIGELCGGHKPTSAANSQGKKENVSEKSGSLYGYRPQSNPIHADRKPLSGKSKGQPINLSPSVKLIRDFKKSEENKCISSPNYSDMAKISTTEWQVLYTTQVTQKAKKFHDGFLQLVVRGSQGRQVKLYDTNRRPLDSKFLKKDEIVRSGELLALEGHLVEVGEQEGDHKPVTDSTHQGKICRVVGKVNMVNQPAKIPTNKELPAGKFTVLNESSFKVENAKLSSRNLENEPRRAVRDILSILKQPIRREVVTTNKPLVDYCFELHSSDVHSDVKDHIKECVEECSGSAREELREKASDRDKVIKLETVEVLVAAEKCTSSENEEESQARSSSSCFGLGPTNCTAAIPNVECTSHNNSSLEPQMPRTAALISEGQKPIESATPVRLKTENREPANTPEISASEEIMTETKAAASLGSGTSSKLQGDEGSSYRSHDGGSIVGAVASNDYRSQDLCDRERTIKLNVYTKEMDEYPSFDLGI